MLGIYLLLLVMFIPANCSSTEERELLIDQFTRMRKWEFKHDFFYLNLVDFIKGMTIEQVCFIRDTFPNKDFDTISQAIESNELVDLELLFRLFDKYKAPDSLGLKLFKEFEKELVTKDLNISNCMKNYPIWIEFCDYFNGIYGYSMLLSVEKISIANSISDVNFIFLKNLLPIYEKFTATDISMNIDEAKRLRPLLHTRLTSICFENCPVCFGIGEIFNFREFLSLIVFTWSGSFESEGILKMIVTLNENLEFLDISGSMIDPTEGFRLASIISKFKEIKVLNLSNNNLTTKNFKIIEVIHSLKNITQLDLSDNTIGILFLQSMDKVQGKLNFVRLSNCSITNENLKTSLGDLKDLKDLDLSANDDDILKLGLNFFWTKFPKLITLSISKQQINEKCVKKKLQPPFLMIKVTLARNYLLYEYYSYG